MIWQSCFAHHVITATALIWKSGTIQRVLFVIRSITHFSMSAPVCFYSFDELMLWPCIPFTYSAEEWKQIEHLHFKCNIHSILQSSNTSDKTLTLSSNGQKPIKCSVLLLQACTLAHIERALTSATLCFFLIVFKCILIGSGVIFIGNH